MIGFATTWAEATWAMAVDSAFLLLISFALAGLLHLVLNARTIGRLVSGGRRRQVFMTALVGTPLPLCSCSVLPVAHQLRRAGVSRAGTASFLISTPESGVDSIVLTYSLMDPAMTVARPIAAFLTAFAAGNLEASFPEEQGEGAAVGRGTVTANACGAAGCGCAKAGPAAIQLTPTKPKESILRKLWGGLRYGFGDLLNDLAIYLVVGYLLAGLVAAVFGSELLTLPEWLRSGWGGYAGAIVIGLPLYVCATSSTPLAAALVGAGFSPGAVLVFLLVGPATNVASLAVVTKILKGWATARYLAAIVVAAILCGVAIDWIYEAYNLPVDYRAGDGERAAWYHVAAAVVFALLLARSLWMRLKGRWSAARVREATAD